jgi:hypothetical protein
MINKLFRTTVVILALVSFAPVSLSAGQATPTVKIYLKCTVGGPSEYRTVTVENNTRTTIPNGTTINWWLNAATQGSITLQSALAPGQKISRSTQPHGSDPFTPKAWYFK